MRTRWFLAGKTFLTLALVVTILAASAVFVGGAAAQDYGCVAFAVELRNDAGTPQTATIFFADPFTGEVVTDTVSLTLLPGETGTLRLVAIAPLPVYLGGGPGGLTIVSSDHFGDVITEENCVGGFIGDGRINDGENQLAAPVAVYCTRGNIEAYKIDAETGRGDLAFQTPLVNGTSQEGGTLLASGLGIELYWRADGKYQLNTLNFEGNLYAIAWVGCDGSEFEYIAPQP